MEEKNLIKIFLTLGSLSNIMEYGDKPRKLLVQIGGLCKKSRDYGKYQKNTLNQIHREVVAKLLKIALIKHDIHKYPVINEDYSLELFSILKSQKVYKDFLSEIRDIGLPSLGTIGIYLNTLTKHDRSTMLVNSILKNYYSDKLKYFNVTGGSLKLVYKSIPEIMPKVTRQVTLNYVNITNKGLQMIMENGENAISLDFEGGTFKRLTKEVSNYKRSKCKNKYKLERIYIDQNAYQVDDESGLDDLKFDILLNFILKYPIHSTMKEIIIGDKGFDFSNAKIDSKMLKHSFKRRHISTNSSFIVYENDIKPVKPKS